LGAFIDSHHIAIEDFKKNLLRTESTSDSLASHIHQRKIDATKSSNKKKADKKEDDLTLMQMYKRSKKSKNAKKSAEKTIKSSHKRSHDKISLSKPPEVHEEATKKQDRSELKTKDRPYLNAPQPPKRQKLKEPKNLSSSSKPAQKSLPAEISKGPHGELLGKLFSSDEPSSMERASRKVATETLKTAEGNAPLSIHAALEITTENVSKEESTCTAGEADDNQLSAASVLLDLGR
jgi:hypothetical protein